MSEFCKDREKLVKEKIRGEEEKEALAIHDAKAIVEELLREKGYREEEIEKDARFRIKAGDKEDTSSMDYILRLNGKRYMAIKCSMAMESRERHVLSFSRVADTLMIQYSVVTDGLKAYLMDTATGRTISEELLEIPDREEALNDMEEIDFKEFPPERRDRETRVLLAFECTSCPKPAE